MFRDDTEERLRRKQALSQKILSLQDELRASKRRLLQHSSARAATEEALARFIYQRAVPPLAEQDRAALAADPLYLQGAYLAAGQSLRAAQLLGGVISVIVTLGVMQLTHSGAPASGALGALWIAALCVCVLFPLAAAQAHARRRLAETWSFAAGFIGGLSGLFLLVLATIFFVPPFEQLVMASIGLLLLLFAFLLQRAVRQTRDASTPPLPHVEPARGPDFWRAFPSAERDALRALFAAHAQAEQSQRSAHTEDARLAHEYQEAEQQRLLLGPG